jgi:adenosylcobinamide kinase/adenosylcobinamide-phosphate guanylyltransferase
MGGCITLVLGGARSGKSTFAEKLACADGDLVTYLATADARDAEMAERIKIHRARRDDSWRTWEGEPEELPEAVAQMSGTLLLDCLTMWLTRLFLKNGEAETEDENVWERREAEIRTLTEKLCAAPSKGTHLIIVSNEVGCGLVPPYLMGRRFRDLQGRMNQLTAARADRVAFIAAGLPLWLKGTTQ